MNTSIHNESSREGAVLDGMVLLSTLLTAIRVRYDVAERKAGRDPSGQEPQSVARAYIHEAHAELIDLLLRLSASCIYVTSQEDVLAASLRRFDDLMMLNQIAGLLHGIHQRLLSLYPATSEALIEDVRYAAALARDLVEAANEHFESEIGPFIDRVFAASARLEEEVAG